MNLYLHALREASDSEAWAKIQKALEPPRTARDASGTPAWYGSDDDAWDEWENAARR